MAVGEIDVVFMKDGRPLEWSPYVTAMSAIYHRIRYTNHTVNKGQDRSGPIG